jgi:hypothetical protein
MWEFFYVRTFLCEHFSAWAIFRVGVFHVSIYDSGVSSVRDFRVGFFHGTVNSAQLNTHAHTLSQKESDHKFDAECCNAGCISVRHEPAKLICHTRPGEEPFKIDADNIRLSEKVKKVYLMGYRVDGRRIRLWLPSGVIVVFSLHPDWFWGHQGFYWLLSNDCQGSSVREVKLVTTV